MKLAIITEFGNYGNYGNILQSYALNRYLRSNYQGSTVETIVLDKKQDLHYTFFPFEIGRRLKETLRKKEKNAAVEQKIDARSQQFSLFAENNIILSRESMNLEKLSQTDYDVFVVGSDVVWMQRRGYIDRIRFLDFENKRNAIKISYAASFGENRMPRENIEAIRKCLRGFKSISVREATAASMLRAIGVENVSHVCDSTLLLPRKDWERLEIKPGIKNCGEACELKENEFCFVYLLGVDERQRKKIRELCTTAGLLLVTIPFIGEHMDEDDESFGDLSLRDCSPQEWLWLIHHSRYVVTDSFHGIVFSTIFSTDFLAVRRATYDSFNVRLLDYLHTINCDDKFTDIETIESFSDKKWDHDMIQKFLEEYIRRSKDYLREALSFSN